MASLIATMTANITYRDVDPDGSECFVCDDRCYLRQVEPVALVYLNGAHDGEWQFGIALCGSCADAMRDSE